VIEGDRHEREAGQRAGNGNGDSPVEAAVARLAATIELRKAHVGADSGTVLDLAVTVGRGLGLAGEELRGLGYGARLHDLGKLAIDDAILHKSGPLADDEWAAVREHPTAGASVLEAIPGLEEAAVVVRFHHERWDGAGYPHGLRRDEIPVGARIVAVCDAYCAMIEERPYRDPLAPDAALAELERAAGSQFDPDVVEAFLQLIQAS